MCTVQNAESLELPTSQIWGRKLPSLESLPATSGWSFDCILQAIDITP